MACQQARAGRARRARSRCWLAPMARGGQLQLAHLGRTAARVSRRCPPATRLYKPAQRQGFYASRSWRALRPETFKSTARAQMAHLARAARRLGSPPIAEAPRAWVSAPSCGASRLTVFSFLRNSADLDRGRDQYAVTGREDGALGGGDHHQRARGRRARGARDALARARNRGR